VADRHGRHADHDPVLIASLQDRDLDTAERATAEAWLASCADCAALSGDLLALSAATRTLTVPPRSRDFMLTAVDAKRLTAQRSGEPAPAALRLADVTTGPRTSAAHASHDAVLVASLVDDALAPPDRAAAEALVATCGVCATLRDDLVTLRAATRALPTPARPRDFALAPDDARRLRPGGWRRFVAAFGTSRDMLSRPLAFGLTSLGLAGLLVATAPSIIPGSGSAAPASVDQGGPARIEAATGEPKDASGPGVAGASAAPTIGDDAPVYGAAGSPPVSVRSSGSDSGPVVIDGPSPTPGTDNLLSGSSKGERLGSQSGRDDQVSLQTYSLADSNGISMLVVLSGAFLIAGLGLFAIRWTARRLGKG
jgi:anti-sigma factor RsiW